jgi:hypothetical protein
VQTRTRVMKSQSPYSCWTYGRVRLTVDRGG